MVGEKTRRGTDVKVKKRCHKKERVSRWLGDEERRKRKRNREGMDVKRNERCHEKEQGCRWLAEEHM